ncbi:MAG: histidinol dehydrogenase [Gammaproteobacteria bacterium]
MNILHWNQLSQLEQQQSLARAGLDATDTILDKTKNIIQEVRTNGDQALINFTQQFDKAHITDLKVSASEFVDARKKITVAALEAIIFAHERISIFNESLYPETQITETCAGVTCERQARPIEHVGLYIPGGTAPLISTVLMLGVPAQIAQCPVKVLCTPPNANGEIDPHILVAAERCGIQEVFKVGGAQAIAALAYGTQTVPKVDKIFGPGNQWVTQAKMLVSQDAAGASIDMPAGPSELMVIADDSANPTWVAADLLSQAEHGVDSQVILVTTSLDMAEKVTSCIEQQLAVLPRREIAQQALLHSRIIVVQDLQQAFNIANQYAPEHLILPIKNAEQYKNQVQNAGAVFMGYWTPETAGDYVTGSNHVLPTNGFARSVSGLSIMDFMKFIYFQTVTAEGMQLIGPHAEVLAALEGLDAHKNAVSVRLKSV